MVPVAGSVFPSCTFMARRSQQLHRLFLALSASNPPAVPVLLRGHALRSICSAAITTRSHTHDALLFDTAAAAAAAHKPVCFYFFAGSK